MRQNCKLNQEGQYFDMDMMELRRLDIKRTQRQKDEARLLTLRENYFYNRRMQHLLYFSSKQKPLSLFNEQLTSCSMVSFTAELSRSWCCVGNQWCMQHG
ncbi:hypothetical protein RRG08_044985 [Elysia crispata]|uniref:Uncharacterized protein n=1 Tax=Elysia crispata TaxID=231223 RepID=A0AAE0YEH9_9GAST|nr:hypothetical protein RRG08_044985 [Elysia crispata]